MPEPNQEPEKRPTPEQPNGLDRFLEERYESGSDTDLTSNDSMQFDKAFSDLTDSFKELEDTFRARTQERIQRLAGPHWGSMMHSKEEAEKYLESSEPSLRQAALYLLYHHWGQHAPYADRYEKIALFDSNDDVRSGAFTLLGSCYSYTQDRRISIMLAKVVLDHNEPDIIRLAAYGALLGSHGYPTEAGTAFPVSFPDDVNWRFVENCSLGGT